MCVHPFLPKLFLMWHLCIHLSIRSRSRSITGVARGHTTCRLYKSVPFQYHKHSMRISCFHHTIAMYINIIYSIYLYSLRNKIMRIEHRKQNKQHVILMTLHLWHSQMVLVVPYPKYPETVQQRDLTKTHPSAIHQSCSTATLSGQEGKRASKKNAQRWSDPLMSWDVDPNQGPTPPRLAMHEKQTEISKGAKCLLNVSNSFAKRMHWLGSTPNPWGIKNLLSQKIIPVWVIAGWEFPWNRSMPTIWDIWISILFAVTSKR